MADLLATLRKGLKGRYHVEEEIGRGGMATVYLAEDLKHGRKVAIKVLRSAQDGPCCEPERFLREIRIAARLTHPQILPLYDSGELGGLLYYVMPYMGGETLRARLMRDRRLPLRDALALTRQLAEALDYAHRQGVVHRDIKPENVMLLEGLPVLADFGVARALELAERPGENLTGAAAIGTPAYMSPEQAGMGGELDGRSDQYSLACVVYEMLSGRAPFSGPTALAILARHATEPPPPLRAERPELPHAVEQALLRALAKDPAHRFGTVSDFARALGGGAAGDALTPVDRSVTVAVLPLVNASADPGNEYLSDGISDELINALSTVEGLRVVSRTSAFAFKGKAQDIRAIGSQLGATVVLEGTVRQQGPRLRITVQLTSVTDGRLLWSERYDRQDEDLLAVQDDIARTIVTTLRATLTGSLGEPEARRRTASLKAWSLYLKGRYYWNVRNQEGIHEAIRHFEAAIREDPNFALAYTGLADAHALGVDYRAAPVADGFQRARSEALRALELDDGVAEAHTSLAWVYFIHDWNFEAAKREFDRAIALDPRYATARQWHSWYLLAMGRLEEAGAEARRAVQLDPASMSIRRSLGWVHYYSRDYDAALVHLRRALQANPTSEETHFILGLACMQQGMPAEARQALQEAAGPERQFTNAVAALGRLDLQEGNPAGARAALEELYARSRDRYVSPVDFVLLHYHLGEPDQAFEWMERAWQDRRGWLVYLNVDPQLDPMRKEPRFRGFVRRMGLGE